MTSRASPEASLAFDHLIFDLDDTLLDTSRLLIPRASREACDAMIGAGLLANTESCLAAWDEHTKHHSRRDLFTHLVGYFGVRQQADPQTVARRGYLAFYGRKVEPDISLISGARDMLLRLRERYTLHLVTSGTRRTQEEKIRILELTPLFSSVHHVDPSAGERKRDAFSKINARTRAPAERHLSIGNRVDTDIAEARALGWKGCWVRYGEYADMEPASAHETPDFTIKLITDLESTCRL